MMPQNLREKLALLLSDVKSLPTGEGLDRLETFFKQELNYLQSEHVFGNSDLLYVKKRAAQLFLDFNPRIMESEGHYHIDQELVRILCYVMASNEYFRSKGLMSSSFSYDRKKR